VVIFGLVKLSIISHPILLEKMKKIFTFLTFTIMTIGYAQVSPNDQPKTNNQELIKMVEIDQKMRLNDEKNYEGKDREHRKKVMELLVNGKIITPTDKLNAALLLQHTSAIYCNNELKSHSPENFLLAYILSKSAYDTGEIKAASYVAITYDRYLFFTEGYQKYGTQKVYDEETDSFLWAPIDTTTTDEERVKYNVAPLSELLKQCGVKQSKHL
jgi:hypothetical protein